MRIVGQQGDEDPDGTNIRESFVGEFVQSATQQAGRLSRARHVDWLTTTSSTNRRDVHEIFILSNARCFCLAAASDDRMIRIRSYPMIRIRFVVQGAAWTTRRGRGSVGVQGATWTARR